ncbi:MAG: ribosome small subunit-dependent GTPase A [Pseudomonadota bacterium]
MKQQHSRTDADDALVVATFSRRMTLEVADGERVSARIKGKRLKPVCGDRVRAESLPNEREWLITAIGERRNSLTRPNTRGEAEVLASNIDQLVIVVSALPRADWFIADRYIAAAEHMSARSVIVFNKTDLDAPGHDLDVFERLGYPVLRTSAESKLGIATLAEQLDGRTSIFVGQSGVGKSSLINLLAESADQRVAEVSEKLEEGRHTTVNSALLRLGDGGAVIDSPGVRDYAPAFTKDDDIAAGFVEIADAAQDCRFSNCRHLQEPGCAVKSAVEAQRIDARRYESYRRLLFLTEKLSEGRY